LNRLDLAEIIIAETDRAKLLFVAKNRAYGSDKEALYNFKAVAERELGSGSFENMYKALRVAMAKHDCVLVKDGLADPDFVERTRDVIVYSLIALGMHAAYIAAQVPEALITPPPGPRPDIAPAPEEPPKAWVNQREPGEPDIPVTLPGPREAVPC
jgi:hypothetical protein